MENELEQEIFNRIACHLPIGVSLSRHMWRHPSTALVFHVRDFGTLWEIWHRRKQLFAVQERLGAASHIKFYIQDQIFGAAYCPPDRNVEWLDR